MQDAVWLVLVGFNDLCECNKPREGVQGAGVLKTAVSGGKGGFGWEFRGECCGIPHLATNELDVGHAAFVLGLEKDKL
jgi:hypothetical protein